MLVLRITAWGFHRRCVYSSEWGNYWERERLAPITAAVKWLTNDLPVSAAWLEVQKIWADFYIMHIWNAPVSLPFVRWPGHGANWAWWQILKEDLFKHWCAGLQFLVCSECWNQARWTAMIPLPVLAHAVVHQLRLVSSANHSSYRLLRSPTQVNTSQHVSLFEDFEKISFLCSWSSASFLQQHNSISR